MQPRGIHEGPGIRARVRAAIAIYILNSAGCPVLAEVDCKVETSKRTPARTARVPTHVRFFSRTRVRLWRHSLVMLPDTDEN